jgi:3-oxoacyl-[acyl-carrier protein] reductase
MLHTTTDDVFRLMLEVHNVAPFKIVREAAPYMRAKKPEDIAKNRSIVNVSSTSGKIDHSCRRLSSIPITDVLELW